MIDVKKIVGDIRGEGKPESEPDPEDPNESAENEEEGGDHKARIQAAMTKIQDGMAELQKCIDEY